MPWNTKSLRQSRSRALTGQRVHLGHLALLYLVFAGLFFLTALFFSQGLERQYFYLETGESKLIPIEVKQDKTVYQVTIFNHHIPVNSWTFIEGEVLDADKEYLFSFADELGHYAGVGSKGEWTERNNSYSVKITLPEAGDYFLNFVAETSWREDNASLTVTVKKLRGSSLPYILAGVVALIIAVVLNEIRNRTINKLIEALADSADADDDDKYR